MRSSSSKPRRGRPRDFDVDTALDKAMRVFWKNGYLGTSLADLTAAMDINRPSLYAAFGNKESLFRRALDRYAAGPATYRREALNEPTARAVVEHILNGVTRLATDPHHPRGCLWVNGVLSCGEPSGRLWRDMTSRRASDDAGLRKRFKRAVVEGDLPADADAGALARFVATLNFGLAVQAATGATRADLQRVVKTAMRAWPPSAS